MGVPVRQSKYARDVQRALGRAPSSSAESALQALARVREANPADAAGTMALGLLLKPRAAHALDDVDTFLANHGLTLGQPLGAGGEAAVFDAGQHVVKLSADPFSKGPYFLPDIPGVAPYVHSERMGPFRLGVQPRAAEVASPAMMAADPDNYRLWRDRADVLSDILARQGQYWDDAHARNLGIMPDGNMAVIDGWLTPDKGVEYRRAVERYPAVEDAIRALLVRPQ